MDEPARPGRTTARRYSPWLDGIRGLAALYVVLHHAAAEVNGGGRPGWMVAATDWLYYGNLAVAVFIVLSGYCLMLPVVRDGSISGGLRGYLVRRARRILPAYYAALALTLLLIAAAPVLQAPNGNKRWDSALPAFAVGSIVPHLLLLHDLKPSWAYKIDPPMWSVAVEWHIYFLFPALALAWRKFGHAATLALATAATMLVLVATDEYHSLVLHPWYMVLFAIGMVAAAPGRSRAGAAGLASGVLWGFVIFELYDMMSTRRLVRLDFLVGIGTALSLRGLAAAESSGRSSLRFAVEGLGCRPLRFLGSFSYSLYLAHLPIVSLISNLMIARGFGPTSRLVAMIFLATPAALAVSYGFHRVFERPFLAGRSTASKPPPGPSRENPAPRFRLGKSGDFQEVRHR